MKVRGHAHIASCEFSTHTLYVGESLDPPLVELQFIEEPEGIGHLPQMVTESTDALHIVISDEPIKERVPWEAIMKSRQGLVDAAAELREALPDNYVWDHLEDMVGSPEAVIRLTTELIKKRGFNK